MPDFHGPIQHVTIAGTLWLILAFPFATALYCAWRALSRRALDLRAREAIATLSIGAMGLAFALSAYHSVVLGLKAGDDRFLLQHLWRMVRVGQLDASFDLAFDPLSATMALVVTGIGLPIFVYARTYMKDDPSYARFFAWLNGFVLAMLLVVLADNFVLLFVGWEGVGLCSWGLIGFWWTSGVKASAGRKAFVVNRVGDVGLVLGIALLYWGLGGVWTEGDYVPDLNARFSSVEVGTPAVLDPDDAPPTAQATPEEGDEASQSEARVTPDEVSGRAPPLPSTTGDGFLTLTSYSGAVVFMDDARTPLLRAPGEFLRAPFARFHVKGGLHSFRIHPGSGLDDFLVTHVAFGEGREIALVAFGPSVTFRNVRDQLAAHDAHGHAPMREALLTKRGWGSGTLLTLACLLLFVGAIGKSAQFPLYVWLPDAMAGPTPVSALIHAATMVTAGLYLVARLAFLFVLSAPACTVIAVVGAGTSLFAATMGLYQYDLKRILAYSTVSQLGLMMLGVGVGAYSAGIFQLVTHACFKACLFLSAGAVVHALHRVEKHESLAQDVRRLGGLKQAMPKTARAYFIACLAITAAPIPGLAGFWSKDEILLRAVTAENLVGVPGPVFAAVALLASGLTSFYMWRSWYLVFEGPVHVARAHFSPPSESGPVHVARAHFSPPSESGPVHVARAHSSPPSESGPPHEPLAGVEDGAHGMTGVLDVLAGLSAIAGLLGVSARLLGGGGDSLMEEWLAPSFRDANAPFTRGGVGLEWGVIVVAYGAALGGWALARRRYGGERAADWEARERRSPLFAASTHGWWVDAIYTHTIVALTRATGHFLAAFDRHVIDSLVNASGVMTRAFAWVVGRADDEIVDGAVRALSKGTLRAGERLRTVETGRVQTYVYVIVVGVLAVAFLQYWLR